MTGPSGRWQRLEEMVQGALERPTDERAAFLEEACGADEDLRREAASLLEREARADQFFATPLIELAANAMMHSLGGTPQTDESRIVVGSRIGAYEIRARLGAGGMGEVYRAHDHTLGRDVAIKVLPATFSADPERLARFEREARMLASLSHPHIGAIYGIEGSGDVRALVLELIDGETLETRLGRGPLPAAYALALAVQIAEALDHAHRQGVTHRDLKPANVMLTKAGAKLLDFGLAKWGRGPNGYVNLSGAASPSSKPSGVGSLTEEGMILGTPHYMAPEQLEGKRVDARADVFAFGAVLYEMLTGRKAFDGGSAPAVMAAVLNAEPEGLESIRQAAPPGLERVVRKCLAKDPDERWQTTHDLADGLKWIAEGSGRAVEPVPTAPLAAARDGWTRRALLVVTVAALAGLAGWAFAVLRDPPASQTITRFSIYPTTTAHAFAISPDGTEIAYSGNAQVGERFRLFVRRFDAFDDTPITGTEDAEWPFYSPDGQWVAFFAGRRLMKVNVRAGSAPVLLCECAGGNNGAVWLADGTIVFTRPERGLLRVSAEGGEPVEITSLRTSPPEADHRDPAPLPGGQILLFTSHAATGEFQVVAQRLTSGERRVLVESAFDARYLASGHLVFARAGGIHAAPFDTARLELTGPIVTLVDRIGVTPSGGYGGFAASASGTLVFRPAPSLEGRTLTWVSRTGEETSIPLAPSAFSTPRVSPDGTRLAFAVAQLGRRDIYTYELGSTKLTQLTRTGNNKTPLWTRDGQRLVYASMRGGTPGLWWEPADGSGVPEAIVSSATDLVPGSWSADGRTLVYVEDNTVTGSRTFAIDLDGDRKPRRVLPEIVSRSPSMSPDGRWLALTAADGYFTEVHVTDFPGPGSRRQVSRGQGRQPLWSRDGRELVYRSGSRMFSVSVNTDRAIRYSAPTLLFERPYVVGDHEVMGLDYDLGPDGRLLMIKPSPDELRSNRLNIVMNWIEEVKQRAASPK